MTDSDHGRRPDHCNDYFAKLMVALELRKTHGIDFAAAFLEQFAPEIGRAAYRSIQGARTADELPRRG